MLSEVSWLLNIKPPHPPSVPPSAILTMLGAVGRCCTGALQALKPGVNSLNALNGSRSALLNGKSYSMFSVSKYLHIIAFCRCLSWTNCQCVMVGLRQMAGGVQADLLRPGRKHEFKEIQGRTWRKIVLAVHLWFWFNHCHVYLLSLYLWMEIPMVTQVTFACHEG